jgi:hypothetical protein
VLAGWFRRVLARPDPIITMGLPRDCGRVSKPARPEDEGWRRSDLNEGRVVRFAACGRGSGKIAADDMEFRALSNRALVSKKEGDSLNGDWNR